ncbi:MAG: hypothetical protein IAE92_07225 [Burkholderiaceae bacterium]|nr:hypothetical protein [Burkholderiaceae bacterium]
MLPSEMLAIAARLHVILRRKTGRVTDTEWLAVNAEYAAAIIRFARESARAPGMEDVAEWADRLEKAMAERAAPRRTLLDAMAPARAAASPAASAPAVRDNAAGGPASVFADTRPPPAGEADAGDTGRYIGGLR